MKSRQKGKKKENSKERVFGRDLQEHLQFWGLDVPQVLRSCAEFVEEHGVVDGIYRLSGVSSNIQKLRQEFEAERRPELCRELYLQDIHCVSSLCKAYFRELPDPLLTYRLYDKFAEAVAVQLENERLVKIAEVLRELPGPNHRTLEYLMRHLVRMASHSAQTNMHARNLAIVWAPNLLRSKDIEASGFNGTAAFMEVRVQSIVVEFILTHVDQLFGGAALPGADAESGRRALPGPLAFGAPEDHGPRSLSYHLPSSLQAGDGPPQIRPYHTIIEIAENKRKGSLKVRKWRSIFNLGRSGHETKRKLPQGTEDREDKQGTLRPAKSMDSLSAVAAVAGVGEDPEGQGSSQSTESESPETAEGGQEAAAEGPAGGSSESAPRTGVCRAERPTGVHISDPYKVNVPPHITSILSATPNIISKDSLARLTRGLECPALQTRPSPTAGPPADPEGQSTESESPETAEGGPEAAAAPRTGVCRAERPTGVHISDPYKVNVPPHIMSILSASPNIISNVSLARLTRGLECPALQTRPSPAAGPPDEPGEARPAAPSLEDSVSRALQDTFSFLEDSSSSELGAEDGELDAAGPGAAFSPDDPGLGYLEELLVAGPQVEEFSVEPPLDDLFLDEAPFVLAPSCCPLAGEEEEEQESGEDIYLSAYDDLSPLLQPGAPHGWPGPEGGGAEDRGDPGQGDAEVGVAGRTEGPPAEPRQGAQEELGDRQQPEGPGAGGEHPGESGEHLKESGEHPKESGEHLKESGEHSKENGEHRKESGEHLKESGEHPGESGEHPKESREHPGESGEHRKESGEHRKESGEHPGESGEHPKESGEHPGESGEHPKESGEHPGESGEHPKESGEHPKESGEHPKESGEHLGESEEHPGESGEHPKESGEHPKESGEHPKECGKNQEESGEHPGESGEHPGKSGEHLKKSSEHQKESGEHPGERGEHPEIREHLGESREHPEIGEHPEAIREHPGGSGEHSEPGGLVQAPGAAGGRDEESRAQLDPGDGEGREEQRNGGRSDRREGAGDREDGEDKGGDAETESGPGLREERGRGDGEAQGDVGAPGNLPEQDPLLADGANEEEPTSCPQPGPEAEGCRLSLGAGVGMRLASSLLQVQHARSVPVVPPKPQFAKVPGALSGKIHVAPASPCPRPGRLDGEKAWGPQGPRACWRNGASLSFDAAVALARDRQRTETRARSDCSLPARAGPCGQTPGHCPRPQSVLVLPEDGAGPRSRLSLPPGDPQPPSPDPDLLPQRRSYAFETQAQAGGGAGL
ncbi:rho GTPase-activating protein 30 [Sorex fumeus]|uniref:rho GTPase-activating protein 30 n=1 Tax=Sorex fumeus TaxID=62283 RepID=UPI0024ACF36F|nr:rho GTPase-activating protein 30 [Sorex fumeus]